MPLIRKNLVVKQTTVRFAYATLFGQIVARCIPSDVETARKEARRKREDVLDADGSKASDAKEDVGSGSGTGGVGSGIGSGAGSGGAGAGSGSGPGGGGGGSSSVGTGGNSAAKSKDDSGSGIDGHVVSVASFDGKDMVTGSNSMIPDLSKSSSKYKIEDEDIMLANTIVDFETAFIAVWSWFHRSYY
ncbi:hypothetical protein RFI_08643, partial [Reticulomyxa filosa]